jgi:PPE-repeat protein
MGQAGECLGGGGAASDSAEAAMAGGAGGGEGDEGAEGGAAGGAGDGTGTGGAGSAGQFPGESDAERAERLGRELEESIGGFDEVLSEEQREVASVGRNMEGFGGDGASGGGAGGISLGEQAAGGSGAGSVAVANQPSARRESPVAGLSEDEIRERTPDDIPVLVDDDIIARQLREAALAEEDPELRERLWEEYRKYNGI